MHKNATKCKETLSKWCKNKHGASKIIDTFETYHSHPNMLFKPIINAIYVVPKYIGDTAWRKQG
jgi:hypothetical protein